MHGCRESGGRHESNGGKREEELPASSTDSQHEEAIETTVEGRLVRGVIFHRTGSDILVRISSPYCGITGGLHIPYFGRQRFSYIGQHGDETALYLLGNVFLLALYIDAHFQELVSKHRLVLETIDSLPSKPAVDMARASRPELRKLLRSGELNSNEYQKKLAVLRKAVAEHECEVNWIFRQFFEENFPMCVPVGTDKQVVEILEGRTSLYPCPEGSPAG